MITVPTTASRFALLQIDSDSDSDASDAGKSSSKGGRESGKARQGKAGASGAKASQCNGKKKDKKKKKKEQQQTEANEVGVRMFISPRLSVTLWFGRLTSPPWSLVGVVLLVSFCQKLVLFYIYGSYLS